VGPGSPEHSTEHRAPQHRQVAKQLTLEMLTKVAVLVDYYMCWEAFDLISSVWINDMLSNWQLRLT
jgi:hypothetical protein